MERENLKGSIKVVNLYFNIKRDLISAGGEGKKKSLKKKKKIT